MPKVSIYTIQDTLFRGEAEKVIARTPMGEITILDNHLPIITSLLGPEMYVIDRQNKRNKINLDSGFLEVRPKSEVVILANLK